MPVLARTLEASGLSTVLITPMPYWAERMGTPRTLAVEFPFGHALGSPGEAVVQRRVLLEALEALVSLSSAGGVIHSELRWPQDDEQARLAWQPAEPSPIITLLRPRFRQILRAEREAGGAA